MKKILSALLVLTVAASAFAMSACNQNNSENNTSKTSSESSSKESSTKASEEKPPEVSVDSSKPKITESQLAEINKKIADNQGVPEFTCKSETINAEELAKDKTLTFVTKNDSNSYCSLLKSTFKNAAKSAGFKSISFPETDGSASKLSDGILSAVTENTDLVMLAGNINKDIISASIENAQANGIEVFSAGSKGVNENDHYVDYTVPVNYQLIGELMADWGIVKSNGKINALAVNCTDSTLSNTIFNGFKKEFENYVSSSSGYCTTLNVTSIEIGNGLANKIKKAVNDDSNINYVFVFDDDAIADAVSVASQLNGKVKVVATGGTTEAFDAAKKGTVEMMVAQSYEWNAYAMVDYALRALGGKKLPEIQDVPVRVVTKESIAKAIEDYKGPSYDDFYEICFGSAFVSGYSTLWNL